MIVRNIISSGTFLRKTLCTSLSGLQGGKEGRVDQEEGGRAGG